MPEPSITDHQDTGIEMRANIGADLAHATGLLTQAHVTAPFARLEPNDAALFRALVLQASVMVNRAHCLLVDATYGVNASSATRDRERGCLGCTVTFDRDTRVVSAVHGCPVHAPAAEAA